MQKEIKDITKYIKEQLKPDEEEEKEIKNYYCVREVQKERKDNNELKNQIKNTPEKKDFLDLFVFSINIYLYEDKIKNKNQ